MAAAGYSRGEEELTAGACHCAAPCPNPSPFQDHQQKRLTVFSLALLMTQVRDIVRSNNGKHLGVQQQACVTVRTMVAKDMALREQAGKLGLLSDIQNVRCLQHRALRDFNGHDLTG